MVPGEKNLSPKRPTDAPARLHKTTSIRYTLCNHKINYVICGGQTSIHKVIIRLQKCPLEANIESACEEWRCDSYKAASKFYAMLGAKM